MLRLRIGVVVALAVGLSDMPPRAHGQPPRTGVKEVGESIAGTKILSAVVEAIDADGMTAVETLKDNKTVTHQFVPVDRLKAGKVLRNMIGDRAYRWEDVKKGDVVRLDVMKDDGDGQTYCLAITIFRRPGAELPKSQDPKKDWQYGRRRIYSEIDNGNDVSDEEILKAFPFDPDFKVEGPAIGGFGGQMLEKLEANRKRIADEKAKKEKDRLKAKPTEKKDDKR
jgi:hypothetical protein